MSSKQSIAKNDQGYRARPTWPECRNCKHFTFDIEQVEYRDPSVVREINLRCGLRDFKVSKLGTCKLHEVRPATPVQ